VANKKQLEERNPAQREKRFDELPPHGRGPGAAQGVLMRARCWRALAMRFGLNFFPSFRLQDKHHGGLLTAVPAHPERADALGYSSIKTVEHSFYDYGGHSPNPCVFLSRWRRAPGRIRLITAR